MECFSQNHLYYICVANWYYVVVCSYSQILESVGMKTKERMKPSVIFKKMLDDKRTIEEYIKAGKGDKLKEVGIKLVQF